MQTIGDDEEDDVDVAGQQVLRPQLAIRALPILGDFDAPREAADAIAVDGDDGSIRRAGGMNRSASPR